MKKFYLEHKHEKGQIIPLVVVMLFVMIAMVALIIDGGALMSNRRTAQAAADAGALAGAKRACLGNNDAKSVGENFATVNGATSALATVVGKQVTVNATVAYPSYFAGIFGNPTLTASAEATAGCYGVKGKGVLPLTWHCSPNNTGGPFDTAYGCQMQTLSWKLIRPLIAGEVATVDILDYDNHLVTYHKSGTSIVNNTGVPPEQIYIIFDGDKLCSSGNECDLDGDGKNDIQGNGDRGYIYLDNIPSHNLKDYLDLPSISLKTHTWLSGKDGKDTSLIIKMNSDGFNGKVVLVPVYNDICNDNPQTHSACGVSAHASPPWPVFSGVDDFSQIRNQSPYFHIVAYAPFYVSCVSKSGDCPGYIYAQTIDSSLKKNEPIIEGYFLTDYDVSPDITDSCSINLGNCTVSLSN